VILFSGIRPSSFSNIARNGNRGSIQADEIFGRLPLTGLIGGFWELCFRIPGYRAPNPEPGILPGEKPALIFPIVRPIGCPDDLQYGGNPDKNYDVNEHAVIPPVVKSLNDRIRRVSAGRVFIREPVIIPGFISGIFLTRFRTSSR
jgi:hypothetical protein